MKRRSFASLWIVSACASFIAADARAIRIGIEPVFQSTRLGSSLEVALTLSDLGAMSTPSLSVYDIDIAFDSSVLSFDSVSFGDPVLGDQLDLLGLGSAQIATPSTASVNVFELSVDPSFVLDELQASEFTLATLTFDPVALGTSPITPTANVLGDSLGLPLVASSVSSAAVSVVPEPGAALLWVIGLLAIRSGIRWNRAR